MKYLILFICMVACKKTPVVAPIQTSTPVQSMHQFELRWITTSAQYKRSYMCPSNQDQNYLINKYDTGFVSPSVVLYNYQEGVPNKYLHSIEGNCITNPLDSIEVQIWIDGVMKAKKKDQNFVALNYEF